MRSLERNEYRFPAIEVRQGPHRTFYTFAVDGKLLSQLAVVSRIRRNGAILEGYQRPEVLSHIAEIRAYLESPNPMIPNAVVVAFDSRVRFEPTASCPSGETRTGTMVIPVIPDSPLPGFIVDGQQRLAAVREARVDTFTLAVNAFITDDQAEQCEQFILVNSTKPLPKGLIYELLPATTAALPTHLRRRRLPAAILERLNRDDDSPMRDRIQMPTNPDGVIKDNSILRMLENSFSDGALYQNGRTDDFGEAVEAALPLLKAYWGAVAVVFPEAWELPPRRSRLLHGAGIASLGFLMDAIVDRCRPSLGHEVFTNELAPIAGRCRWTSGYWDFGPGQQRKWNEVQNTSRDIQLLSNYLLVQYRAVTRSLSAQNPD